MKPFLRETFQFNECSRLTITLPLKWLHILANDYMFKLSNPLLTAIKLPLLQISSIIMF